MTLKKLQTCIVIENSNDEVYVTTRLFKRLKVDLKMRHYARTDTFLIEAPNIDKEAVERSILIADLNLGMASGIDIIRTLRGITSFSTIVMGICSGSEDPAEKAKAQAAGADFFVDKPLDLTALEEICRSVPSLEFKRAADNRISLYQL